MLRMAYHIRCDDCGRTSPPAQSQALVREQARADGWRHVEWYRGVELIKRDFCPVCWRKVSAESGRDRRRVMVEHRMY